METVYRTKIYGEAGVRDPRKMNLALGSKILWRIVSGKRALWKEILQKKNMNGTRRRCMDKIDHDINGTPIQDLCNRALYIIQDHLYWIPGSGK